MQADYARRYRELWDRHWWWRSRERWLLAWIERLDRQSPRQRVLDVGCGDGLLFERLEELGVEVEGVEPDAAVLNDARWRDRIRVAPVEAGIDPPVAYDLVLMLDVLEHIADESRALATARAALRPGGHLLLTVPALAWLWSRHDEANAHYRRYGKPDLRLALERAGFVVETLRFFFVWTVAPMLVRRMLWPAGVGTAEYDVSIPPPWLNGFLTTWSRCEHALGYVVPWPVGSSLLAVARRPL